mmetsp:Transcript_66977/g.146053  ORF Transcript_66977/g.146053 Transcript_66977/m.146053 type:complete len:691 (+) Transcript_66977:56-2128(+)
MGLPAGPSSAAALCVAVLGSGFGWFQGRLPRTVPELAESPLADMTSVPSFDGEVLLSPSTCVALLCALLADLLLFVLALKYLCPRGRRDALSEADSVTSEPSAETEQLPCCTADEASLSEPSPAQALESQAEPEGLFAETEDPLQAEAAEAEQAPAEELSAYAPPAAAQEEAEGPSSTCDVIDGAFVDASTQQEECLSAGQKTEAQEAAEGPCSTCDGTDGAFVDANIDQESITEGQEIEAPNSSEPLYDSAHSPNLRGSDLGLSDVDSLRQSFLRPELEVPVVSEDSCQGAALPLNLQPEEETVGEAKEAATTCSVGHVEVMESEGPIGSALCREQADELCTGHNLEEAEVPTSGAPAEVAEVCADIATSPDKQHLGTDMDATSTCSVAVAISPKSTEVSDAARQAGSPDLAAGLVTGEQRVPALQGSLPASTCMHSDAMLPLASPAGEDASWQESESSMLSQDSLPLEFPRLEPWGFSETPGAASPTGSGVLASPSLDGERHAKSGVEQRAKRDYGSLVPLPLPQTQEPSDAVRMAVLQETSGRLWAGIHEEAVGDVSPHRLEEPLGPCGDDSYDEADQWQRYQELAAGPRRVFYAASRSSDEDSLDSGKADFTDTRDDLCKDTPVGRSSDQADSMPGSVLGVPSPLRTAGSRPWRQDQPHSMMEKEKPQMSEKLEKPENLEEGNLLS